MLINNLCCYCVQFNVDVLQKWEALASKEKTAYESAMSEWKKKERSRPSDSPPWSDSVLFIDINVVECENQER